jgi:hypothetical protein
MDIFTRQPFKGLYLLSALAFELTTLPYILLTFLTSSTRPHPQWTFRQSLMVRVIGAIVKHTSIIQAKTPLPLSPDKESEQFVVIEPASSEYYTGPLLSNPDVKPIRIGATWYPAPLTRASKTENVTSDGVLRTSITQTRRRNTRFRAPVPTLEPPYLADIESLPCGATR